MGKAMRWINLWDKGQYLETRMLCGVGRERNSSWKFSKHGPNSRMEETLGRKREMLEKSPEGKGGYLLRAA